MDALRTAPRTPSPMAAAALERLAAIITQRGSATRARDLGCREPESAATGTQAAISQAEGQAESRVENAANTQSDGASRAWPGGVHACDAHRPCPESQEQAATALAGHPPTSPGEPGDRAHVSPDMLVMARRGVHEFIGLIDDTRELERLSRIQLEGTDGTGGDVGRDVGRRGGDDVGDRDASTRVASRNGKATGRGHTGGVPSATPTDWSPPLTFATWLAWLAWRATISLPPPLLEDAATPPTRNHTQEQPRAGIAWVGRAIWPGASLLHRCPGLMNASLLVDCDRPDEMAETSRTRRAASRNTRCGGRSRPPTASELELRVWAAEQAIRSGACSLVVADGSGFSRVMTQRLQLAAESGYCSCVLLRRPREVGCLSAATTRWIVHRAATSAPSSSSESARCRQAAMAASELASRPASELTSQLASKLANKLASAEVWSTGWIARLWRSKGATSVSMQTAHEQAWLLRMVYRADDLSRFNDKLRNAPEGQPRLAAGWPPSGFDLVPVLVHRSAQASDATSPRARRAAG